ncbi:MAG: hypothetical protein IPK97_16160 [Ahniella sp.]|nr:hypothetical protein [Ahniella sp.]
MRAFAHVTFLVLILGFQTARATPVDWQRGDQLVVVTSADWNATEARVMRFEKRWFGWRPVGKPMPAVLGRNGSAWGLGLHPGPGNGPIKQEGDGKAPAGLFRIGLAFGSAARGNTGLAYQMMDTNDWCIDVPGSPLYNRIVDRTEVGDAAIEGSTEPMRRDLHANDDVYRFGFVIEHNSAGRDRAGSCIFAHLWRAPDKPTAGCTALAEADLETLMGWLDARHEPRFLLLPNRAYETVRRAWKLPRRTP